MAVDRFPRSGHFLLKLRKKNEYRAAFEYEVHKLFALDESRKWLEQSQGKGLYVIGFDGSAYWRRSYPPRESPFNFKLSAVEARKAWYQQVPLFLAHPLKAVQVEDEVIDGKSYPCLQLFEASETPCLIELVIDPENHQIHKTRSYYVKDGQQKLDAEYLYEDYRLVQGFNIPHRIKRLGPRPQTITILAVTTPKDLDDNLFQPWSETEPEFELGTILRDK